MKDRFSKNIGALINTKSGEGTILAVSGGIDSVVMAHLFHNNHLPIKIAHCNFQLRGKDSDQDEAFVENLASSLGADFKVKRFDTEFYAKENGMSIQMAARDLRYNWFKQLSNDLNAPVAIAHNANDVVETILFNLSKGTGIAGLHGISEKEKHIIRPILWASRSEILVYAKNLSLEWKEDSSNQSEKYMRNLVRKSVIPQFERINPSFISSILKTSTRLSEVENVFHHYIDKLSIINEKDDHKLINKNILFELPGKGAILYYLLSNYGFNFNQTDSMAKSLDKRGAMFYSRNWMVNIDREYLILSKNIDHIVDRNISIDDESVQLVQGFIEIEIIDQDDFSLNPSHLIANLDLDRLNFPLRIRNWQEGDRFRPLGMEGKKLISDYLIDEKVPVKFKREQLVILSHDEIVWLVGKRIDERYKITDKTRKICRLKLNVS